GTNDPFTVQLTTLSVVAGQLAGGVLPMRTVSARTYPSLRTHAQTIRELDEGAPKLVDANATTPTVTATTTQEARVAILWRRCRRCARARSRLATIASPQTSRSSAFNELRR